MGYVLLSVAAARETANRSELNVITGRVTAAWKTRSSRSGQTQLNIDVIATDGTRHLTQIDMTDVAPGLRTLQTGDTVSALARHDRMWRDRDWYWEVQRGGRLVLAYEQTEERVRDAAARTRAFARVNGMIALALVLIGSALRVHYGSWRDSP